MATLGQFKLLDYTIEDGVWKLHFENSNPGPSKPTDYYCEFALDELPTNINQTNLANMIKTRLSWTVADGHAPLTTAVNAGMTITLP